MPLTMAPWNPSLRTPRSSSFAAASGSRMARCVNPAKRSGCRAIASARWSLTSRAMSTPSLPSRRSAPGPGRGQHLHGDARRIHRRQPLLADLRQQLERAHPVRPILALDEAALCDRLRADALDQRRHREMLFQRNDPHDRPPVPIAANVKPYASRLRATMAWMPLLPSTSCVTRRSQARLQNT